MPVHIECLYFQYLFPCIHLLDPQWLFKAFSRNTFLYSLPKLLQTLVGFSVQHSFLKLQEVSPISHKAQQCPKMSPNQFWSWTGIECLVWWTWQWLLMIGPLSGLCLSMILAHCPHYFCLPTHFWKKGLNQNGARCNRMLVMPLLELPSDAVPWTMLYWAIGFPLLGSHHEFCLADIPRYF